MIEKGENWVTYSYYSGNETELDYLINLFQNSVGGERRPYAGRAGAIDLVTFVDIIIPFAAGVALTPLLKKYFEGLFNADEIKKLGERHRQEINRWFKSKRERGQPLNWDNFVPIQRAVARNHFLI